MTVKDANKWLEGVQSVINNTHNIQKACSDNPELWENFAEQCDVNMGLPGRLCGKREMQMGRLGKVRKSWRGWMGCFFHGPPSGFSAPSLFCIWI